MTAKEIVENHLEFCDLKQPIGRLDWILQGVLCMKAKAKNGKWYEVYACSSAIVESKQITSDALNIHKENIRTSLFDFLQKRTGIKGYRGRFQFVDFELHDCLDSSVERPYSWRRSENT